MERSHGLIFAGFDKKIESEGFHGFSDDVEHRNNTNSDLEKSSFTPVTYQIYT
jgi:hypothetical protein